MNHVGKVLWVPSDREYHLICKLCGVVLLDDINGIELEYEGECEPEENSLGVHAVEEIGSKDIFGGDG